MSNAYVLRNLLLGVLHPFGTRRPKTPIRWLCLKSFTYLAQAQNQKVAAKRCDLLNQAIELGVYLNRCFDRKCRFQIPVYRGLRKDLPPHPTREYLSQLRALEQNRPDFDDWSSVYHYRRSVLEISLAYLFRLSHLQNREVLLPLCSLIQLVDDVLDKAVDERLGLPTFLSVSGPAPGQLARDFWSELRSHRAPEDRPFVVTGWFVYLLARTVIVCRPG